MPYARNFALQVYSDKVLGREMQGDSDFAVAAISMSTLLSGLTFLFWLHIAA